MLRHSTNNGSVIKPCLIYNIGMHYRLPIFKKMGEVFGCEFYFGDHIHTPIKRFDYGELNGFVRTLHNSYLGQFYWQQGSVGLIFMHYTHYIIIGEPYNLSSWVILLLSKLSKKRVVGWTHGWYGDEKGLKNLVKKVYFNLFDSLLVYGEYSIRLMEKEGVPSAKMHCVANSLNSESMLKIRHALHHTDIFLSHFGNNHPVIIYCGRIQKVKRLDMILRSMALLNNEEVNVNAVFVGGDVDGVDIKSYAKGLGIEEQVWLYGPCYDERSLSELFFNASVCVSPGNVGLTAIHSLSYGCPVITHDNFANQMPEFEAIKPGVTGDFYQYEDEYSLAHTIKKWCNKTGAEREAIRNAAYEEIDRKWNVDYQIGIMKGVLSEV